MQQLQSVWTALRDTVMLQWPRRQTADKPPSTCLICFETTVPEQHYTTACYSPRRAIDLKCRHVFCTRCLRQVLLRHIDGWRAEYPLSCPAPGCSTELKPNEMRGIINQKLRDQWRGRQKQGHKDRKALLARQSSTAADMSNEGVRQLLALAAKKRWQQCPNCHNMVSRFAGCDNIPCRCGTTFCYRCGQPVLNHKHRCVPNQ